MPITTLSSREFNQDRSRVKKAVKKGPVFVTDRGRPSMVLLSFDEYQKITSTGKSIVDLLRMPEGTPAFDFDFEFPRLEFHPRPVDFD
jgi:prevent-host-death family protein